MKNTDDLQQEQLNIVKITEAEEKDLKAPSLRSLWRECFGDPPEYEDFYFSVIYLENTVYMLEDKGMLHVNPYLWQVQGQEMLLHYIVGVATNPEERRKGIMRSLLVRAMQDMYGQKEPFTYLMPANVEYYKPFGFVSLLEKQEICLRKEDINADCLQIQFVEYRSLTSVWEQNRQTKLFAAAGELLAQSYSIYAVHDRKYFELLYQEKSCQNGNVVFCFEGAENIEHFLGFFAYGMDEDSIFVEQYLFHHTLSEDVARQCCYGYFQKQHLCNKEINLVEQFPYMIRVVHMESFLQLFHACFEEFIMEQKALQVEDAILPENNGVYVFSMMDNEIRVEKQNMEMEQKKQMTGPDGKEAAVITVSEVADYVGRQMKNSGNKGIFFAEVV